MEDNVIALGNGFVERVFDRRIGADSVIQHRGCSLVNLTLLVSIIIDSLCLGNSILEGRDRILWELEVARTDIIRRDLDAFGIHNHLLESSAVDHIILGSFQFKAQCESLRSRGTQVLVEHAHTSCRLTDASLISIKASVGTLLLCEFPRVQLIGFEFLLVMMHQREVHLSEGGDDELSVSRLVVIP